LLKSTSTGICTGSRPGYSTSMLTAVSPVS